MPDLDNPGRRAPRLDGYDYSQNGMYFVTICVQNRLYLFGSVNEARMKFNAAGEMLAFWWNELAVKFSSIKPTDFVVMPNHFHGILVIDQEIANDKA
jgi:putative transposase